MLRTEVQCWQADESIEYPKSMTFINVTKLSAAGLNRRRQLIDSDIEHIIADERRQMQSSSPFELKCILSEIDVRENNLTMF